jgi:hypothetical protein
MFTLFKKKKLKEYTISCATDSLQINDTEINFPCEPKDLINVFDNPSREIENSNKYLIWDDYGLSCTVNENETILSLNVYQENKSPSEYVPKKGFNGKLFFEEKDITFKEFSKIGLGKIAIHRLGSESETRFGFSIGVNTDYK